MRHFTRNLTLVLALALVTQAAAPVFAAEAPVSDKPVTSVSEPAKVVESTKTGEPAKDSAPAKAAESEPKLEDMIVKDIGVEGLKNVPSQVVLSAVKKTEIGKKFNADSVQTDLQSIFDTGYFQNVEATLYKVDGGVKVVFLPVENDPVKRIEFESTVLDAGTLRKYFAQKDGEVANLRQMRDDLSTLQNRVMADHGFVVVPAEVNLDNGVFQIKIVPVKVNKITLEGNDKTHDNVIMREINVKPGDNLNMNRLNLDLQHLWQTGYFDEVQPEFPQPDGPEKVDIVIKVVERKTGSAAFGAGYSTLDGLLGYLEYSEDNFLGRGQHLNARTEFGQKKNSYDLGFYEPYLFGTRTSYGVNLYDRSYDRTDSSGETDIPYKEHRKGGDMSIGRPMGEFTQGEITLKVEDAHIAPDDPNAAMPVEDTRTRSIAFSSNTDTTIGHPFYPVGGMRATVSAEAAGQFLGGDSQFTKFTGETSRYFKVGRADQVLAFRLVGGTALGDLPTTEMFSIGGADTVRGYRYGEMKGNRMLYANGEYRFKISNALQAALFVDAGQAWNGNEGGPGKLKVGYGAGLRIDTPLGMMRLDYGIGEKGGSTFFSLGPAF